MGKTPSSNRVGNLAQGLNDYKEVAERPEVIRAALERAFSFALLGCINIKCAIRNKKAWGSRSPALLIPESYPEFII